MHATLAPPTRSQRLRAATRDAHETLDRRIMDASPFASRDRYACFLRMQYRFHRDVDPLFFHPMLAAVVPDLAGRRRLDRIALDLADLGLPPPAIDTPPVPDGAADIATILGWFYVVEGSNLGVAILIKHAAALGLDEHMGARHLAGHPDGRARHWRGFVDALDALPLDPAQEERLAQGARDAFARVQDHAMREFAG